MVKLKYVGKLEQGFIPGVPQADHEVDEKEAKELVASGLYAIDKSKDKED